MKRYRLVVILAFSILTLASLPDAVAAAPQELCFGDQNPAITNCIGEPFKSFWEQNGGLPIFGYPLTGPSLVVRSSSEFKEQWFERVRLDLPIDGQAPTDMRIASLGETLLQSQQQGAPANRLTQAPLGCLLYPATGHTLCAPFLSFYRSHGRNLDKDNTAFSEAESEALFGLPLTEPTSERAADGTEYQVQWFQRARFEIHPPNSSGAHVSLGRLGVESLAQPLPASPASGPSCSALPVAQHALIDNTCLNAANRYHTVFSLKDYQPHESLGAWLTDADGVTIGVRSHRTCTLQGSTLSLNSISSCSNWLTNQYGHASGVDLDGSALYPGRWMLVLRSKTGDGNTVIFFEVLPHPPAQPDPCAGAPAAVNAIVIPSCGQRGSLYKIVGQGFTSGEDVVAYITGPDTIVEPLTTPYYYAATTDASGNVTLVAPFPDSGLKGDYFVTIVGLKSGHKAIGGLRKF